MSDTLDTEQQNSAAWAWYDPETGVIKHVSLIKDHAHPDGTIQISIERESAIDILLGKSKLSSYVVVFEPEGTDAAMPRVIYRQVSMLKLSQFWHLDEQNVLPFMGEWQDAESFKSPLRIRHAKHGVDIRVVSSVTKGKIYITLKNDPNYLIQTISIEDIIKRYGLDPMPVDLSNGQNYSFYVRYNHAA